MSRNRPPLTAAQHITEAKEILAAGGSTDLARTHAFIAIAELMATNMTNVILDATTRGALAATEAFSSILSAVNPGATTPQHHCDDDDPRKCAWPGHRR